MGTVTRTFVVHTSKRWPIGGASFSGVCLDIPENGKLRGKPIQTIATMEIFPKGGRIPQSGEVWEVSGEFKPNPLAEKLGVRLPHQLNALSCNVIPPKGTMLFHFLQRNDAFKNIGIGKATWQRIFGHFEREPDDLLLALNNCNIGVFVDNHLLTSEVAGRLIDAWRRVDIADINIIAYLHSKGFDGNLGNKLRQVWGAKVEEYLKANPYYMVAFEKWPVVDRVALSMFDIASDDPRRYVGAVLASVYHRLVIEKCTLTRHAPLIKMVKERLGVASGLQAEQAILLAAAKGVIVGSKEAGWQPDGAAEMERRVKEWILAICDGKVFAEKGISLPVLNESYIDRMIEASELAETARLKSDGIDKEFRFNPEQRAAIHMAVNTPFCLIYGGPGTGKTTTLRTIEEILRDCNIPFYQMALAGRAATRMAETTGEEASTITRFLNRLGSDQVDLGRNPYIIIDESSMCGLPDVEQLLRYLRHGCRFLLLGDPDQLGPIQFGLVFQRLVMSQNPKIKKIQLVRTERQEDDTGIPDIAAVIRNKQTPSLKKFPKRAERSVSFYECSPDEFSAALPEILADIGGEDAVQILGLRYGGIGGIDDVNVAVQDWIDERLVEQELPPRPCYRLSPVDDTLRLSVGDRVIFMRNDLERDLNNGSLGWVLSVSDDGVECDFDGNAQFIGNDEMHMLKPAFCISVHKGQGSQFTRVVVCLVGCPLLDRNAIYTALTRGVEQVVIVGRRRDFELAISKSNVELLEVGLTF